MCQRHGSLLWHAGAVRSAACRYTEKKGAQLLRVFSHYVSARLVVLVVLEGMVLALAVNWGFSLYEPAAASGITPGAETSMTLTVLVFVAVMLSVMNGIGLYEPDLLRNQRSVAVRLVIAAVVGLTITCTSVLLVSWPYLAVKGLATGAAAGLAGSCVVRWMLARWCDVASFKPRVLVLGNGSGAAKIAHLAQRDRTHEVVGCIDCGALSDSRAPLPRLLPAAGESLFAVAEKYGVDHIVIAVKDRRGGGLPVQDLLECRLHGMRVSDLSSFFEREYRQVLLESLTPSWMVFGEGFRQGLIRTIVKRVFDIAASLALLLVTFPVMLIAAVCIICETGRPVLYRQERVGQGGRSFTIYKFRSMSMGAESDGKPRWAGANDDRTTRAGRFMRKTRIDELPQIFNVLKGEMSFVGPRPERPYFVDKLRERVPYYALRHSVKPGITGWAQVRYPYGASVEDAIQKLQYDLYYVKNHTLFLDLVILAATVEVVLWGGGSGAAPVPPERRSDAEVVLAPATLEAK
jgi:sugar transferase (PEP-CTERM system associated)